MLLEDKVAVIYGAGGPVGGAVARAFAASERTRTLSSTDVNLSCGATLD